MPNPINATSITTLAERLGVSIATVSRALNDKPGVSTKTRNRILEAAAAVGYAPNAHARGMALATTNTVGFLFHETSLVWSNDPFYLQVMRGVERTLLQHGFFVIVSTIHESEGDDGAKFQLVREKRVDGLILCSPFFSAAYILTLKSMGIPLVLIDNYLNETAIDCVLIDDANGGYLATRHLIEHGHHQIAFIGGPSDWSSNRARETGYRRAMAEANLTPIAIHQSETTMETGRTAATELLQQQPDVTAVFCANDAMAFGVLQVAKERKIAVPRDLAVIGFDDVEAAQTAIPTLTTMHVPKQQLGVLAARRLLNLLESPGEGPVISTIPVELTLRTSCGCREKADKNPN